MKKILFFLFACIIVVQASDIESEEDKMIDWSDIVVKYVNFQPKKIDKACLDTKVKKLFTIIIEVENARKLFSKIPTKEYFLEKNKEIVEKIEKAQSQLNMQKHKSYKGNHEWQKVVESQYLLIESKKNHLYVMYPLEKMMFIMSGIPFEKIKKGESIAVRGLKEWIDMKECMRF